MLRVVKKGRKICATLLFGHAATGVGDGDRSAVVLQADRDGNGAGTLDGLDGIEKKIEHYLVNLVAVVFDFWEIGILVNLDLDGSAERPAGARASRRARRWC